MTPRRSRGVSLGRASGVAGTRAGKVCIRVRTDNAIVRKLKLNRTNLAMVTGRGSRGGLWPRKKTRSAKSYNRSAALPLLRCSAWSSARPELCHGDAGDCEQPADDQLWGHAL